MVTTTTTVISRPDVERVIRNIKQMLMTNDGDDGGDDDDDDARQDDYAWLE